MKPFSVCLRCFRLLVVLCLVCISVLPPSNAGLYAQHHTTQSIQEELTSRLPSSYPGLAQTGQSQQGRNLDGLFERVDGKEAFPNQHVSTAEAMRGHFKDRVVGARDDDNPDLEQLYIVGLLDAPLSVYNGTVDGFSATNAKALGQSRLNVNSAESLAYRTYLGDRRSDATSQIAQALGRSADVLFEYEVVYNGLAMRLTPTEAAKIAKLESVAQVTRSQMLELHTDYGPAWIGAPGVWDGSGIGSLSATKGEGVVVGIIDGGIDLGHPSFATLGADGYLHTNARGQFYGLCDPLSFVYNPAFSCTEKLIGAWDFVASFVGDGRPMMLDEDSHGTHVASTAAGNVINPATLNAPAYIYTAPISGVAPHANIIAYDACFEFGCPTASTMASVEQAVIDGVDVINYSIGGGSFDPWLDPTALAFLNAVEAGVFVATSAGNSGPEPQTMGSPANAPWMMAIGSSTHNRRFPNNLIKLTSSNGALDDIAGQSLTIGYGPAPIVYAGDYGDALCSAPFESGTFAGEIVVCDRGINARVAKGANVLAGGAGGFVLANDEPSGDSVVADAHFLPGLHISYSDGVALKAWLASGSDHSATIEGTIPSESDADGDIMSGFSSRGPDATLPDVIKPDVTAPGDSIFAAFTTEQGLFNMLSGTSMSSPHVTGAGALLKALHPDWTPAEIRSALMLTARTATVRKEDGVTPADPFDRGAGHIDVTAAANAGFVMDESASNFAAADPLLGGLPTALNLASLGDGNCVESCQWTRTIRSTADAAVDWSVSPAADGAILTVEPAAFTLEPGATQTLSISADVTAAPLGDWSFGTLNFAASSDAAPNASMPVAIFSSPGDLPDELRVETRRNAGQQTVDELSLMEVSQLSAAVYAGDETTELLAVAQDPTNGDPFDLEAGGVVVRPLSVPENIKRLVVRTQDSESPDLDLFVGLDSNGDGIPTPDELLCFSATFTADEVCDFLPSDGDVVSGEYWVLVQNWLSSGAAEDNFTLSMLMIDNTESDEITVETPASVESGVPISMTVFWSVDDLEAGENVYSILELRSDEIDGGVVASMPLTLVRLEDDVTISSVSFYDAYPAPIASDGQTVQPGDLVDLNININPDPTITQDEITYHLETTLPEGMSYVDGSATVEPTEINGNQLVWDITLDTQKRYEMTTSLDDVACGSYGYINLEDFGILANPDFSGDEFTIEVNDYILDPMPISYWGNEYASGLKVTANGLAYFDTSGSAPDTSLNLPIPDAVLPNNLMAPFWRDLEVVYDETTNRGLTIDTGGTLLLMEYDDVEPAPAGSTDERFDFQILMDREVFDFPGFYEIVFMYNNLNGSLTPATIGIENEDGTDGLAYAYNDADIFDFFNICFDWVTPSASIDFQAEVDFELAVPAELTTVVSHSVNAPSTETEYSSLTLSAPAVLLDVYMYGPYTVYQGEPIIYSFTVYNDGIGTARDVKVETSIPAATTPVDGLEVAEDGTVLLDVGDIPGFGIGTVDLAVMPPEPLVVSGDVAQAAVSAAQIQAPPAPDVVGGGDAEQGEFPWVVAVVNAEMENAFDGQFCGGSLISEGWVLTAAHCVTDFFSGAALEPEMVDVIAGIHTLSSNEGQRVGVSQIVRYPYFSGFALEGDVALLRLEDSVIFNQDVAPVRLLKEVGAHLAAPYTAGIVAGWGATNDPFTNPDLSNPNFDYADTLQQTTLPLISNVDCATAYDQIYGPGLITPGILCAGFPEGGKSACFGDSGGPLIISDGNGGWLQAGLVVGGESCGFLEDVPNIYSRISYYDWWINGDGQNTYITDGYYRAFDADGNQDEGFNQITTVVVDPPADGFPGEGEPPVPPPPAPELPRGATDLGGVQVHFDAVSSMDAERVDVSASEVDAAWLADHPLEASNGLAAGYFAVSASRGGKGLTTSINNRFDQALQVSLAVAGDADADVAGAYALYHYNSSRGTWATSSLLTPADGALYAELSGPGAYALVAVGADGPSEQPEAEVPDADAPDADAPDADAPEETVDGGTTTDWLFLPLINSQ